jgi:hypothetical protein
MEIIEVDFFRHWLPTPLLYFCDVTVDELMDLADEQARILRNLLEEEISFSINEEMRFYHCDPVGHGKIRMYFCRDGFDETNN